MYKKIIDSKNISIMSITTSYLAIFILIGIALINVLWFFLLPAKGERNPTVRLISDMERAIKSSEDAESANWNILRRKVKQYQLDFNLLRDNSGLNQEELNNNSQKQECNSRTECPICLCSFPENTLFYKLNCSHLFCIECCEKWFNKNSNCPLCRNNYK